MKNYYCLGTSDTTAENAIDILKRRLDEKKYPLYKKTPFLKDIKKDDEVVFYVAGKKNKSQNFIAFSHIKSVETPNELLIDPDKNKYILEKYLLFENLRFLGIDKNINYYRFELENGVQINNDIKISGYSLLQTCINSIMYTENLDALHLLLSYGATDNNISLEDRGISLFIQIYDLLIKYDI